MMFVDTWAWIALAVRRDQHHGAAIAQHSVNMRMGRKYVTTNYVLSELITYLYSNASHTAAPFVDSILESSMEGSCDLVYLTADQFDSAWRLRKKYHDKPDISFVDFTSMAVMREVGIVDVFTGDAHFEQVGMGFQLHPKTS